jgi:uncharacterized protein (TIGR00725 family)
VGGSVARAFWPRIGVIGGNEVPEPLYAKAEEVGRLLARAGAEIFCGGMGGAMEAVCKGAEEAGGRSIALLPDDHTRRANAYVTIPIATGMGYARNYLIVHNSDALIAIGGAEGTLNEMAAALNMGLTVVSLESWEVDRLGRLKRGTLLHARTAKEAVDLALAAARERRASAAGERPGPPPASDPPRKRAATKRKA